MNKIYKLDAHNIDTTLPRFTNSLLKIFEFEVLETNNFWI